MATLTPSQSFGLVTKQNGHRATETEEDHGYLGHDHFLIRLSLYCRAFAITLTIKHVLTKTLGIVSDNSLANLRLSP
jgi:hypothetical protein